MHLPLLRFHPQQRVNVLQGKTVSGVCDENIITNDKLPDNNVK